MVTITLAGEKGGIGKTTLAFHLACHLAECGYPTLAVDLDPQANLSYTLSGACSDGIRRALGGARPLAETALEVDGHDGWLHLLSGDKSTAEVRNRLAKAAQLDALEDLLGQAHDAGFAFTVVDTPPSPALDNRSGRVLDTLTAAAFFSADLVLAPVIPESLPLGGLAALSATLDLLQRRHGSPVRLAGVVPVMYDARTREHAANLVELVRVYGHLVYPVVGRAIAVAQCPAYGLPLWRFAPQHPAARQLRQVAGRLVSDAG